MSDEEHKVNHLVKILNENVGISQDVELIKLMEKDKELQKQIDGIDKKRREEFETLQKEIVSLLED